MNNKDKYMDSDNRSCNIEDTVPHLGRDSSNKGAVDRFFPDSHNRKTDHIPSPKHLKTANCHPPRVGQCPAQRVFLLLLLLVAALHHFRNPMLSCTPSKIR